MIFVTYHRISADFVPGLTPHSSVATSGEMTVTSGMPRSNFGGLPTEISRKPSKVDSLIALSTIRTVLKRSTVRSCRFEKNTR